MEQELLSHLRKKSQGTLELIHTMDNYLFVVDFDGNILLTSDSLNDKAEVSKKSLDDAKFYDLLRKEDNSPLDLYDLLLLDRKTPDLDLKLIKEKGAKPIDTMLISSSILSNFYKDQDYILILLADMREQKKTQMHLMHTNKMVSLGEMASGIAHEINNPLTVVMGQLTLLRKHIERLEGDQNKIETLSDKIYTNFERITKIVKSLQTMSRNSVKAPKEDVKISAILNGVKDLSSQRLDMKNVNFSVEGDSPEMVINCRETEILQVLLNLVNNSVDSIEDLEDRWVKIIIKDLNKKVAISVMDAGSGIDLAMQIRLFEPFYTTKSIGKGTGLGLSISKSLIEAHEGSLEYDTSYQNTCFTLMLPK